MREQGPSDRTLSDLALELVDGPRQEDYDEPSANLGAVGTLWGVLLRDWEPGTPIPAWMVSLMMSGLKIVRAGHKPGDDSLIDACGYLELVRRLRPDAE